LWGEPTLTTYLGRIRIYLPAVVFGLGASNVDFVAALLDVLHRSNFQDVVDDGQKFHTVSQQFLADALACGKMERQNTTRQPRKQVQVESGMFALKVVICKYVNLDLTEDNCVIWQTFQNSSLVTV